MIFYDHPIRFSYYQFQFLDNCLQAFDSLAMFLDDVVFLDNGLFKLIYDFLIFFM